MKSYDKATWHIDGGEKVTDVIERFREVFRFLAEKEMLSEDGEETYEYGMDSSVSLNSTMVNKEGKEFLDIYYDEILEDIPQKIRKNLSEAYNKFKDKH